MTKTKLNIPEPVIDSLAGDLIPIILKAFENEEFRKGFEEWKKQRQTAS